jgi:hypothetical protein
MFDSSIGSTANMDGNKSNLSTKISFSKDKVKIEFKLGSNHKSVTFNVTTLKGETAKENKYIYREESPGELKDVLELIDGVHKSAVKGDVSGLPFYHIQKSALLESQNGKSTGHPVLVFKQDKNDSNKTDWGVSTKADYMDTQVFGRTKTNLPKPTKLSDGSYSVLTNTMVNFSVDETSGDTKTKKDADTQAKLMAEKELKKAKVKKKAIDKSIKAIDTHINSKIKPSYSDALDLVDQLYKRYIKPKSVIEESDKNPNSVKDMVKALNDSLKLIAKIQEAGKKKFKDDKDKLEKLNEFSALISNYIKDTNSAIKIANTVANNSKKLGISDEFKDVHNIISKDLVGTMEKMSEQLEKESRLLDATVESVSARKNKIVFDDDLLDDFEDDLNGELESLDDELELNLEDDNIPSVSIKGEEISTPTKESELVFRAADTANLITFTDDNGNEC